MYAWISHFCEVSDFFIPVNFLFLETTIWKSFLFSFIHISRRSWILFDQISYNIVVVYFDAQIVPKLTLWSFVICSSFIELFLTFWHNICPTPSFYCFCLSPGISFLKICTLLLFGWGKLLECNIRAYIVLIAYGQVLEITARYECVCIHMYLYVYIHYKTMSSYE